MKEFPSATIHLAVNLVDCYLQQRPVSRSKLQLLGISSMLLAARWMGVQIITIREAAWLTDNTYKYEEVVQMMGEMFAVFRGNIRVSGLVWNIMVHYVSMCRFLLHIFPEYIM